MAFDEKKFLKAFGSIGQTSSALDFAKLNAARSTGASMPDLSTIGKAATAKAKEESTWDLAKGALSNTFGWLMTPVRGVENVVNDVTDAVQGENSFGQTLQNLGHDVLGTAAGVVDPVASLLPGKDPLDSYIKKHNETIHGGKATTGLNTLLNMEGNKELDDLSLRARNFTSLGGFLADVGLDPLTYATGGASALGKAGKVAEEGADLTKGARSAIDNAIDTDYAAQIERSDWSSMMQQKKAAKLHPIKVDENHSVRVTKATKDSYDEGINLEAIDRPSLAEQFAAMGGKNNAHVRARLKGIEDANNIHPSDRLSTYLDQNKKTPIKQLLEEYTVGKPSKIHPTVVEATGPDYFTFDKESKGLNVGHTLSAVDDIVNKRLMPPSPIGELADASVVTPVAEKFISNLKGKKFLRPADQAKFMETVAKSGDTSLEAMHHAEELAMAKGVHLVDYNGGSLRLSDVWAEIPAPQRTPELLTAISKAPGGLTNPVLREAFARAGARRSIYVGEQTKNLMQTFQKNLDSFKVNSTPVAEEAFRNGKGLEDLKKAATAAGFNPNEIARLAAIAKNSVTVNGVANATVEQVVHSVTGRSIELLIQGKPDKNLISKMNKAVGVFLGHDAKTPTWKKLLEGNAEDGILYRYTTWWGRGDEIHNFRQGQTYMDSANKATEAIFAEKMAQYPKDIHAAAWAYATRKYEDIEVAADFAEISPQAKELGLWMRDFTEHMFGSESIYNNALRGGAGGVVAVRANMTMQTVNKHLANIGSPFRFHKIKDKPWFASWENFNPDNPLQFVHDLQDALGRATTEYALIDDFVERAGQGYRSLTHTAKKNHPRFPDNTYFRPEDLHNFERLMDDIEKGPWLPKSKAQRTYFSGLRAWKTGVTIYSPSHHIRNLIGDSWLMWVAGYNNPQDFVRGFKVISAYRDAYKGAVKDGNLEGMLGLIKGEDLQALKATKSSKVVTKYNANLTTEEIYTELFHRGQLPKMETIEDLVGRTPLQALADKTEMPRVAKPLNGSVRQIATGVAEAREHFVRASHFIAAVEKRITPKMAAELRKAEGNLGKRREILKDIYDEAAREVTKWHPDGRDLTRFEQSWMRGVIPFYAWQRKAIPLVFEAMAKNPAKLTAYPKGMYALQNMLGMDPESITQPFPNDQLYPSWMRWGGIGPIGDPQSDNPVAAFFGRLGNNYVGPDGTEYGDTIIDPGRTAIPFDSLFADMGGRNGSPQDIGKGVLSMLTPAIKIPFELMQGTKADTGAPISKDQGGRGYLDYAANNTPIFSNFYSMAGKPGANLSKNAQQAEGNGSLDLQRLINFLTAAGVTGTGPYAKSAEFDVKEEMKRNAR